MARIAYDTWGGGALPLVLLHGFTGNRSAFDHLRPRLEGACRVLAVDLPGHGQTPLLGSFTETVDALWTLMDREGFALTHVLGYALGARVALGLASRRPEGVMRLLLESGSPGVRRRKARLERRRDEEQWAQSLESKGLVAFVERLEALPQFVGLRQLPERLRGLVRSQRLSGTVEGYAGSLRALGMGQQPNYWPELPGLRMPVLLLTGARDEKFTEVAKQMAAELPQAWRKSFADAGHAPHLEVPEQYVEEVLGFLSTPWLEGAFEGRSNEGEMRSHGET